MGRDDNGRGGLFKRRTHAQQHPAALTRLWGELKELGVKIGKSTLRNILKENGVDPGKGFKPRMSICITIRSRNEAC